MALAGLAALVAPAGAAALPGAAGAASLSQADLAVTSPPGPIVADPGTTASVTLMVGNVGYGQLPVTIESRRVDLLDGGRTKLVPGTNREFAGRVTISPTSVVLPPRHEVPVTVTVEMPPSIEPNDYFLGFLVSPAVTGPSTVVENDIGALVILNVPGPRSQHLVASFAGLPLVGFSLSSSAGGSLTTRNLGATTVQYATTIETSGVPSPNRSYATIAPQLLPPGLERNSPVRVSSWLGLGWYTLHASLVYGGNGNSSGEAVASRTVVIVNPLWLLVPTAMALGWIWRRRTRRRRSTVRHQHSKQRGPPARAGAPAIRDLESLGSR